MRTKRKIEPDIMLSVYFFYGNKCYFCKKCGYIVGSGRSIKQKSMIVNTVKNSKKTNSKKEFLKGMIIGLEPLSVGFVIVVGLLIVNF